MKLLIVICAILCIVKSASFEVRRRVVLTTIQLNASKGSIFSSGQGFDKSSNRKHMRLDNDDSIEQLERSLKYKKPVHKLRYDTYHNKKLESEDIPRKYSIDAKTGTNTDNIMTLEMSVNPSNVENKLKSRGETNDDIGWDYLVYSLENESKNVRSDIKPSRSYGLTANYKKSSVESSSSNNIASVVEISTAVVDTKSISTESNKPTRSYGLSNYKSSSVVQQALELNKKQKFQTIVEKFDKSETESARLVTSVSHKQKRDKNVIIAALKFIVAKINMLIPLMNIKLIFSRKNYANFLVQ